MSIRVRGKSTTTRYEMTFEAQNKFCFFYIPSPVGYRPNWMHHVGLPEFSVTKPWAYIQHGIFMTKSRNHEIVTGRIFGIYKFTPYTHYSRKCTAP